MTERLKPGSYYLFAPKHSGLGGIFSLSFGRDKEDAKRISALIKSAEKEVPREAAPLLGNTFNPAPATYSLGGGTAVVVQPGLFDTAGDLLRVQPTVVYDSGRSLICIFNGYLSNLDELLERYPESRPGSPRSASGSPTAVVPSNCDQRQLAAELVQRAYLKNRSGDLLVLLSELQGQYAFVVYDGEKRCVFAARDSSGKEPLYYEIDEDNALSVSNAELAVPADPGFVCWSELPAGHYISGRTPKVGQFALTPEQLSVREYYESLTDEFEGASSPHAPPGVAVYGEGARSGSSELDVFPSIPY